MKNSHSESYAAAGVDVTAGYEAVERIKPMVESTYIPGVMGTLGGFGGMFAPDLTGMKKPVLVSGTDGVGTKLKLAFLMDKHDTVGIDVYKRQQHRYALRERSWGPAPGSAAPAPPHPARGGGGPPHA